MRSCEIIDIGTEEVRDTAAKLAGKCDVVLENFRPGLMASFVLDLASAPPLAAAQTQALVRFDAAMPLLEMKDQK